MTDANQTFIPKEDRPTGYDLDTSVSSLRVRDLATILHQIGVGGGKFPHPKLEGQSPLKEFFDKPFPEVIAPVARSAPASSDIDRVVQAMTGLTDRVEQLAAKVDELEGKIGR